MNTKIELISRLEAIFKTWVDPFLSPICAAHVAQTTRKETLKGSLVIKGIDRAYYSSEPI